VAIYNSVMSPVFGALSDAKRPGQLGKRKPFLLAGLPFMVIGLIMLWSPPALCASANCTDSGIIAYLWIALIIHFTGYACVRNPYTSMIHEQSTDEVNRIKISSMQGVFSIISAVVAIILPILLFSHLVDPQQIIKTPVDRQFLLSALPLFGIVFGCLALGFTIVAFLSVDESFLVSASRESEGKSVATQVRIVFRDLWTPFKDGENLKWLGSDLCLNTSMRIVLKILQPVLIYVLLLKQSEFTIFLVVLVPFVCAGFVIWQRRAKLGLKIAYVQSILLVAAGAFASILLVLVPGKFVRLAFAVAVIGFIIFNLVTGYILPNPITAKLVDDARERGGKNLTGSYFGAYLFVGNMASALGDVILGIMLAGSNSENPVSISMLLPVAASLLLAAALVFRWSKMK